MKLNPSILIIRFILVIVVLNTSPSFGQSELKNDSLAKYSYNLIGYALVGKTVLPIDGSCFFIRNKERLFLVSANHMLCGCDDNGKKFDNFPQILNLVIHNQSNEIDTLIGINFKPFQDTCKCEKSHIAPDIAIIELNPPKSFTRQIFSVEKFLLPLFKDVGDLVMYGFPGADQQKHPSGAGLMKASLYDISQNRIEVYTHMPHDNVIDSLHYIVYGGKADSTLKGYSGSPVFLQDAISKSWRLLGVFCFFGIDYGNNRFIGVGKIEAVLNRMGLK